jgi:hypothetical protein
MGQGRQMGRSTAKELDLHSGKRALPGHWPSLRPQDSRNLDFDRYPFKAAGLLGNLPFDGRFTVIVDLPNKRFGLIAGSAADLPAK